MASRGSSQLRLVIDLAEKVFLLSLIAGFLYRFIPQISTHPYDLLLIVSEIVTATMVIIRRSGDTAIAPYPVALGFLGTAAPLLVTPQGVAVMSSGVTGSIMFAGLFISLAAKIFLNRSLGLVAANRGVKRRGPYRWIRHPMYAGYMVIHIGFLLSSFSFWNVCVYIAAWLLLVLRIAEEEKFLYSDEVYREYAASVRYRLLPGVY